MDFMLKTYAIRIVLYIAWCNELRWEWWECIVSPIASCLRAEYRFGYSNKLSTINTAGEWLCDCTIQLLGELEVLAYLVYCIIVKKTHGNFWLTQYLALRNGGITNKAYLCILRRNAVNVQKGSWQSKI